MRKFSHLIFFIFLFLLSFFSGSFVFANTFQVTTDVTSTDFVPPSAPSGVTATAISQTEIDLAWTASTDDVGVLGYRVYRDGNVIANIGTTTLTYSDTGLTSSTLYTYFLSAFDGGGNESSTSTSASATTLSPVIPPPPPSHGGGRTTFALPELPQFLTVSVFPNSFSALVHWTTRDTTQTKFLWGKTSDNELGILFNSLLLKEHEELLTNLLPNQMYFFAIEAVDVNGKKYTLANQSFKTLPYVPPFHLPNVNTFRATPTDASIELSWQNSAANSEVRIIKRKDFYPQDPYDGALLYEGSGTQISDTKVVPEQKYYYALFVKSSEGEFSSGSLASAKISHMIPPVEIPEQPEQIPSELPPATPLTSLTIGLLQDDKRIFFTAPGIQINASPFVVYVQFKGEQKPKSATLEIDGMNNQSDLYLLRQNNAKGLYLGGISTLSPGKHDFSLLLFDKDREIIQKTGGFFEVKKLVLNTPLSFTDFVQKIALWFAQNYWWFFPLFLIFAFAILFFVRHRFSLKKAR